MKKLSFLFFLFVLLTAFTCENEPIEGDFLVEDELSCEIAAQNTQDAAVAFLDITDETYSQLCIDYKNALEVQILFCGDSDGSLQTQINSLGDCSNGQTTEGIVGTWLLTAWIGEEAIDLNNDGTESVNFLDEMDCYENETYVFNADNTAVNMSTSFASFMFDIEVGTTDEFDYTIDCEFENENTNLTWTQSGNLITIDDGTGAFEATLNGNQFSLFVPEGFTAFNSDFTSTTTQDLTFIYTRQ
ncbi:hypothetical protein [Psychroserpens sp.]